MGTSCSAQDTSMLCKLLLEFTYHWCSLSNIILRRFHHNWWWVQKCNNKRQYQRTLFTISYLQTQDDLGAVFTSDPIALLTDPSWLQKFDATIAIHSSNKDVQAKLFKYIILPPSPGWCWQINLSNDHMPHPGLSFISVKHFQLNTNPHESYYHRLCHAQWYLYKTQIEFWLTSPRDKFPESTLPQRSTATSRTFARWWRKHNVQMAYIYTDTDSD